MTSIVSLLIEHRLANVAGTQEPEYGPSAIQSVAKQAETTPYTEATSDSLKWEALDSTCVETHVFYIFADNGNVAMVQLIYNSLAYVLISTHCLALQLTQQCSGIRTTTQVTTKIFYADGRPALWTSEQVDQHKFTNNNTSFHSTKASFELSSDGTYYTIKSKASPKTVVDLKAKRAAPGFVVGKNGTSYFGTDPKNPWGSMRHAFWPRVEFEGDFVTQEGPISMKGTGVFIHALQGMKPHHLAARWNFSSFHNANYSAVMMEFITPPSYGSTNVNVGGIVQDGKLIYAGSSNTAKHTGSKQDTEVNWPEPTGMSFEWNKGGSGVHAELSTTYPERTDRVDVMAEVPGFVKQLVGVAAGTRPYIYQVSQMYPPPLLKVVVDIVGTSSSTSQL